MPAAAPLATVVRLPFASLHEVEHVEPPASADTVEETPVPRSTAALRLAESLGDQDALKNALYLLGEVANLNGDLESARGYFGRLHRDFFPEAGYLPDFLLVVDIRRLVNLHA